MKKLRLTLVCCLLVLSSCFIFAGCNESEVEKYAKQGYTAVCSIKYNGASSSTTTLHSYFKIEYDDVKVITYDEYVQLNYEDCPFDGSYRDITMSPDKKYPYTAGKMYKSFLPTNRCYSLKIAAIEERYVYVKILNDNTLDIITGDRIHYAIKPTSYEIVYFK